MTCHRVDLPGIGVAIVCGPRRRERKCRCGAPATKLCDWPKLSGNGTCDRAVCDACAVNVGPDRDYCPAHAKMAEKVAAPADDTQGSLF